MIEKHYALLVSDKGKELFGLMMNGNIILKGKKIGKNKRLAQLYHENIVKEWTKKDTLLNEMNDKIIELNKIINSKTNR